MNDREKLERAHQTRAFMQGAAWQGAFASLREVLIDVMETGNDEQAMDARRQLGALRRLRANLEMYLQDEAIIRADKAAQKSRLKIL